ncbi:hypothetical protein LCGC14_1641870 [marine sediment metagenome]|uniref:DUF7417 domain-containing protein n=1 Tax=marine sediment metagenome TaxID=412755 RepID=A0A0F9KF63_9ZZZZ
MKHYYYSDTKNNEKKNNYLVYCIDEKDNWSGDIGERKCRTVARLLGDNLAGGFFVATCKPFNFKNYTVVNVPRSTHTSKLTKEDISIAKIIAYECGELDDKDTLKLFSKLIKTGQCWSLQGCYGRTAKNLIDNNYIDKFGKILIEV